MLLDQVTDLLSASSGLHVATHSLSIFLYRAELSARLTILVPGPQPLCQLPNETDVTGILVISIAGDHGAFILLKIVRPSDVYPVVPEIGAEPSPKHNLTLFDVEVTAPSNVARTVV